MCNVSRLVVALVLTLSLLLTNGYAPPRDTSSAHASTVALLGVNGITWASRSSGTNKDLYGVSCSTARTCVAVGSGGTILTSVDGALAGRGAPRAIAPYSEVSVAPARVSAWQLAQPATSGTAPTSASS